ncbi:MAG: type I restriction endonuclease subunit R [bacterium]|nr:type I restriction endonuclease subunit R [bacterium]
MSSDSYREITASQLPALRLLMALGWNYLPPAEALALRGGKRSSVILEGVLAPWLRENNHIHTRGRTIPFTEANIQTALNRLRGVEIGRGLIPASMEAYDLLTLPISLEQIIDGDKRSFDLRFIDWQHPETNVYHVTDEFEVERETTHATARPDIVLFVNGIPLAVIECKRSDTTTAKNERGVYAGIEQMLRNQGRDYIPRLFAYAQVLMAVSPHDALYATTGASKPYWAEWREEALTDEVLSPLVNRPLSTEEARSLYDWRDDGYRIRQHFQGRVWTPTQQDRGIYALLRPARLLELAYGFIVFDGGVKKIARYQQYFAIRATMERVTQFEDNGARAGGVIWHTTGSGKSLTMVMLAKALALHPDIPNPRVVLVTDRIDLDEQIWKTFKNCGKQVFQAESGSHLIELVKDDNADIVTTVIDKFETAARRKQGDDGRNIFVLVDESHRGQYGLNHDMMRAVFRYGCYIGFTGTPLLAKDKTTAAKFGGFIHKYTMRQAVEDGAVVPLLYEGRVVELDQDRDIIDADFDELTETLSAAEKRDLKNNMSRREEVFKVRLRLKRVARDIATHYKNNWRGSGFKAQFATPSKALAVEYEHLLTKEGIRCAVVISAPDTREGTEEADGAADRVVEFWRRTLARYHNDEKTYLRETLRSFREPDGLEILIVVDKLLVGFDEPRNTVLYVDKSLREHGLLQAIARVNRLYENKAYGYIIDYRGVLGELNEAMEMYSALEGYDAEDVAGTLTDNTAVIATLPQVHSDLWAVFKTVTRQYDSEVMERFLEPEDRRHEFYDALTAYAGVFKIALSTLSFHETTPPRQLKTYKEDLAYFHRLRNAVRLRYAEAVEYGEYEARIRELLNDHIKATSVTILVDNLNIFDRQAFDAAVAELTTPKAKADTILSHAQKTITERMDENPAFYRRLSQLIDETIQAYREERLSELELAGEAERIQEMLREEATASTPAAFAGRRDAPAYHGLLTTTLESDAPWLVEAALAIEDTINRLKIRDWVSNLDVQKQMARALDECLYEMLRVQEVTMSNERLDAVIEALVALAKSRDHL